MEKSLFKQWVDKLWKPIADKIVSLINGKKDEPTYLHKSMLTKDFSPNLKWESLTSNTSIVAADVVSMDSPLPLKKRDSITLANGDIPKLGMKLALNERTMTDLNILRNMPGQQNAFVTKLFADTKKAIFGVYEQAENIFLQALSSGVALVPDANNVGTGIRVDYGVPTANKFGVSVLWSSPTTSTPIDDIERVLAKADADGNTIVTVMMDKTAFNNFKKSTQVKELFAANIGFMGSNIPVPTLKQVNEALNENYSFQIKIIDRTIRFEKNGVQTSIKPWADGAVTFLTSEQVGRLVYGQLAEEVHKAKQVDYQKVDDYILLSKFHKVDPLAEFTTSQALVLPVLDSPDAVYLLDSKTVQA